MAHANDHKSDELAQELVEETAEAAREYSSQADYMAVVAGQATTRVTAVVAALRAAFASAIRVEELEVIEFQSLSVMALGAAIAQYPVVLKPLLIACNVAARAIERDLDLRNIDTYGVRLAPNQAHAIAGYIKPFLPASLPLAALTELDRVEFIDKEIRAHKGRWEKMVNDGLSRFSGLPFRKVKFRRGNEPFEIDCAYQAEGRIVYAVDVKRIEARRDIHKRSDEIVNKAVNLKQVYPEAKFGAVVYYPFTAEHGNIRDRLQSPSIDSVQFAGQSQQSINQAVRLLLAKFGVPAREVVE